MSRADDPLYETFGVGLDYKHLKVSRCYESVVPTIVEVEVFSGGQWEGIELIKEQAEDLIHALQKAIEMGPIK